MFYRETWAEIDLAAIEQNVLNMKEHLSEDKLLMVVVKADAYGHGAVEVSKRAIESGANYLGVATVDEGIELREAGLTTPILVLGWTSPKFADVAANHNITLTVFQKIWFHNLNLPSGSTLKVHLAVDTGMTRIGIRDFFELEGIIREIKKNGNVVLEGMFTHFATADEVDTTYTEAQYELFEKFVEVTKKLELNIPVIHCGNSAFSLRFPERIFNMARLGISLYGITPAEEMNHFLPYELKPALSLFSTLSYAKKVSKGEKIGYGSTYESVEDEWIGTITIGYADGLLRRYGEKGEVLINGRRCKIVGRVCMDQIMVRLPEPFPIGSKVTLIGKEGFENISIDEMAERSSTNTYEIACTISKRVPRVYL
jgi:alanine racemase